MRLLAALLLALGLGWPAAALGHELRPAFLDLREVAPDRFEVMWKVPARGDLRLGISATLPEACVVQGALTRQLRQDTHVDRWTVDCTGGLKDRRIGVDGLPATMTEVLVRIEYIDGTSEVARLTPDAAGMQVAGAQTALQVAGTYFALGVEHILGGIDHLLFVLALMLLIRDRWMLFKTITAFTLAHSLTLAGSALGWFSLPQGPVEAVIALSIAFVARELLRQSPGERRLSEAYPWLIAFSFGLLHGFGFAGALKEIGLPQADVPLALLTFNLGVEAGQLIFVAAMLLLWWTGRTILRPAAGPLRTMAAYGIGAVATFWFLERVAAFSLA